MRDRATIAVVEKLINVYVSVILREVGAASRDDAIFSGERCFQAKVYFKGSGLILNEPVLEVFGFRPVDWPEKYFF